MYKRSMCFIPVVFLLALAFMGCSNDGVVSPPLADTDAQSNDGLKVVAENAWVHVTGNVHYRHQVDAVGVDVLVQAKYGTGSWYTVGTATTGAYGFFSIEHYCTSGTWFRCVSLGDIEEKQWFYPSYYLNFQLTEQLPGPVFPDPTQS